MVAWAAFTSGSTEHDLETACRHHAVVVSQAKYSIILAVLRWWIDQR